MKKIHWFTDKDAIATPDRQLFVRRKEVIDQVLKVLRLKDGERIAVRTFGVTFEGKISSVTRTELVLSEIEEIEPTCEQKKLALFFCIPKKDKFELILEKCTEIGVTDFYPVISDRTIKTNINEERSLKIIEEAAEQAQRTDTPTLHEIRTIEEVVREFRPAVFDTDGGIMPKGEATYLQNILIGPEGGFSEKEQGMFAAEKLDVYKLKGPILKTETAAITICSLARYA